MLFGIQSLRPLYKKDLKSLTNSYDNYLNRFKLKKKHTVNINFDEKTIFLFQNSKKKNYNYLKNTNYFVFIEGQIFLKSKKINCKDVLNHYLKNGEKFYTKYDGSFFILIFNIEKRLIKVFKNLINSQSFYYYKKNKNILFGTNLYFFLKNNMIDKKFNNEFLTKYTTCNYRNVYGRIFTPISGVSNSLPHSILSFNSRNIVNTKNINPRMFLENIKLDIHNKKALAKYFNYQMKTNLKNQIIKKEETCFLSSGGFDSAQLLSLIQKKLNIFTMYFSEENFNEIQDSKILGKLFGNKHTFVKITPRDFKKKLKSIYKIFDSPIASASQLAFYILYKKLPKNFKKVVTGYGGDYVFGGSYRSYLFNLADIKFKYKNKKLFKHELKCWRDNNSTSSHPKNSIIFKNFERKFINKKNFGKIKDSNLNLVSPDILKNKKYINLLNKNKLNIENLGSYLKSHTLNAFKYESVAPTLDADVTIDASSDIKTISPYLNNNIINFSLNLDSRSKIKNGINRFCVRDGFSEKLPKTVTYQIEKRGFNVPIGEWFRKDLKKFLLKNINKKTSISKKIFINNKLKKIIQDHMSNKENHAMFLWQILNLELWSKSWKVK